MYLYKATFECQEGRDSDLGREIRFLLGSVEGYCKRVFWDPTLQLLATFGMHVCQILWNAVCKRHSICHSKFRLHPEILLICLSRDNIQNMGSSLGVETVVDSGRKRIGIDQGESTSYLWLGSLWRLFALFFSSILSIIYNYLFT